MTEAAAIQITIKVRSKRHGMREFTRVGFRPHRRKDGTMTTLAVWATKCVRCGAEFNLYATARSNPRGFGTVHCPDHRRANFAALSAAGSRGCGEVGTTTGNFAATSPKGETSPQLSPQLRRTAETMQDRSGRGA